MPKWLKSSHCKALRGGGNSDYRLLEPFSPCEEKTCHYEQKRSNPKTDSDFPRRAATLFTITKKAAFTLSEVLITLSILGVVATLTLPSITKKYSETANRTKIRKAMAVYETAVNEMRLINNLRSNSEIDTFANGNNCVNTSQYFKVTKKVANNNNCRFMTADKLYWDISDLRSTTVAFKQADLTNGTAELRKTTKAFKLISGYQDDVFMVNSQYYYDSKSNVVATTNLIEYAIGESNRKVYSDVENYPVCTGTATFRKMSTNQYCYEASGRHIYIYNSDGNMIRQYYDCPVNPKISDYSKCSTVYEYVYDQNLGAHTDLSYEKATNAGSAYTEYYTMIQYNNSTGKKVNASVNKCTRYFCSILRNGCDNSGQNCSKCYDESKLFNGGNQGTSVQVSCN